MKRRRTVEACPGCSHGPGCRIEVCPKCARRWHVLGIVDEDYERLGICSGCDRDNDR